MTLTLSVCHTSGNPALMLRSAGLNVFQSSLSALAVSFLFRERLRPSRPPIFFLPGICEKKKFPPWKPLSSSHNARLRADEELICIMTKAVNELGLEWSPLRSHLAAGRTSVFSRGAIKPPRQRSSPFFPEVHTSSRYCGTPHPTLVLYPFFCFSCSHIC